MNRVRLRPPRPTGGRLAIASCLVALAAGCSGDDDATPSTTATTTTTTAVTTTAPVETTSAPIQTTSAPSTAAPTTPTTPPPTTVPPTTSGQSTVAPQGTLVIVTDPDDPDVAAMLDGFRVHFDAFTNALRDPTDVRKVEAALATSTGDMRRTVERTVEILNERNQAARANPDFPTSIEVDESSITLGGDAGGFDACWTDGDSLVIPAGNPDGSDEVIESGVESDEVSYGMSMVDGDWLVSSIDFFRSFEGQLKCG